jgi:hypothetical protein
MNKGALLMEIIQVKTSNSVASREYDIVHFNLMRWWMKPNGI